MERKREKKKGEGKRGKKRKRIGWASSIGSLITDKNDRRVEGLYTISFSSSFTSPRVHLIQQKQIRLRHAKLV